MPVLKLKKDGVWEEIVGISEHSHSKNDITDFPNALPADGGNADTLDGKHASDFATTSELSNLNTSVDALQTLIGDASVAEQITDTIAEIGAVTIDIDGATEGTLSTIDADTFAGNSIENFAMHKDLENFATHEDLAKAKAGFIYPLASYVVPNGFLLCDGASYSRTEYQELFAAIGTMYGEGDGSTTFNVPNLKTRVPVGAGNGYTLGDIGGEETHILTGNEMPAHSHFIGIDGVKKGVSGAGTGAGSTANCYTIGASYDNLLALPSGSSQPHNNMQPYTVVNYIIATGKDTGVSVSDIVLGAQQIPLAVEYGGTGATNSEMARRNLEITPDNINAMRMELLWENASPTSAFAEQAIFLDLSEYEFVEIIFNYTNVTHWGISCRCEIGKLGVCFGSVAKNIYRNYAASPSGVTIYDGVEYTSYNGGSGSSVHNNTWFIPAKIYGIKGALT